MHFRFVRLKIDEEKVWDARSFYEESVFGELEKVAGCLYAGLLQGAIHGNDLISLTVWTDAGAAAAYEQSGLFDRLLDESDERLLATGAGPGDGGASPDLVVFSGAEPEIETWEAAGPADPGVLERMAGARVFVRMVAIRLRREAVDEFRRRYDDEVRPALATTAGCLGTFLVAGVGDPTRVLSFTVWAREEDAVRYGLSGDFDRLTVRLKDTFSELYGWGRPGDVDQVAASFGTGRGLDIEGYQLVTGRTMK
ncbi:MAG: antibiotic biosynthesis monooxygenase [Thermoanaerobaculales bacterium]|jgi:heme-degrading monooxygenase HmoA|nr:antibiotic biosynthesis monooxygenase [Thermoanaerobaculales bacterium]